MSAKFTPGEWEAFMSCYQTHAHPDRFWQGAVTVAGTGIVVWDKANAAIAKAKGLVPANDQVAADHSTPEAK